QAARCLIHKACQGRRDGRVRIHAVPPVGKLDRGSRHIASARVRRIAIGSWPVSSNREQALVDRRPCMLNHEQRNVLENVAVVQTVPASQNMFALSRNVVCETYSWTKVLIVI